ncbi:dienelactone hydrolase family protein [Pseudomonas sp. TTU2014-080ASC]|uniref:dienelactone hydrolase family protein n=1 Tax=Pseudomonas sp. TTU2014-080ASC TaxID=1729724 RepID=UPI0009EBFE0C|nr:dienelactone hydrolase family protein [Pseudomonas sp. TTU2014-080ASC]
MATPSIPSTLVVQIDGVEKQFVCEAVSYELEDESFEGLLVRAAGVTASRPGLLMVPNWLGVNLEAAKNAARVADERYVVLLVDMYGKGMRPANADEAQVLSSKLRTGDRSLMRKRTQVAISVLQERADEWGVDADRLGAVGFCFGGSAVLELARSGADLSGFVSFHGSLDTPHPTDAQNIKAPVLVLHGADDPIVPQEQVQAFIAEMKAARVDWQLVVYGGAVHSFTSPMANVPGVGEYHPAAAQRAYKAMDDLFEEVFKL